MKKTNYPLIAIIAIPTMAFTLFVVGCGSSGNSEVAPNGKTVLNTTGRASPIEPQNLRECTNDEFSKLQKWSFALLDADNAIINQWGDNTQVWTKKAEVISLATKAINQCDTLEFYHELKPCKKTIKNIVSTTTKGYDAFTIHKRCERVTAYLSKFKLRPNPKDSSLDQESPAPQTVPTPTIPAATAPSSVANTSDLRECSSDEFSKLNQYKISLDRSNKAIAALGNIANWKYDSAAITSATTTTKTCEALIQTFQNAGCKKIVKDQMLGNIVKTYTSENIKQECQTARSYYYDFTQRQEDLIMPNANLILDTKVFSNVSFSSGYSASSYELCVVTNTSNNPIKYNGEKALVTQARVYPSGSSNTQMFVMQTKEGLKLECYGLNYQGASTSLNEVRRLLKAKGLSLNLGYELK